MTKPPPELRLFTEPDQTCSCEQTRDPDCPLHGDEALEQGRYEPETAVIPF